MGERGFDLVVRPIVPTFLSTVVGETCAVKPITSRL